MEESWENWHLHTDLDCDDDYFTDGDEFLREILLQQPPAFSSESESDYYSLQIQKKDPVSVAAAANGVVLVSQSQEKGSLGVKSNSSNSMVSQSQQQQQQQQGSNSKTTHRSSSPTTYILSFDNMNRNIDADDYWNDQWYETRMNEDNLSDQNLSPSHSPIKKY